MPTPNEDCRGFLADPNKPPDPAPIPPGAILRRILEGASDEREFRTVELGAGGTIELRDTGNIDARGPPDGRKGRCLRMLPGVFISDIRLGRLLGPV